MAWRGAVDAVLANRILRGDTEALQRRLDAFAPVGDQLAGLLSELSRQAKDGIRGARLHTVWPFVLDRLLPQYRHLAAIDGDREEPSHRDVAELDDALLLVPPANDVEWPWRRTVELGIRWVEAFTGRADHADRAIHFVGTLLGLTSEIGISIALRVMGDNVAELLSCKGPG